MHHTLSEALSERGYETLTAVQEAVTDPALEQADLLVSAQTGSGKTVGFGLAIAPTLLAGEERMGPAAAPLALIVAPTRELAFQVRRELEWLYARTGAQVTSCVGGMDMRSERRALERGAHIVVGTPGRLRDHIQRGSLELESIRAVVLDEADEMLDLGFREDLEFMLAAAPEDRRTLMFSATVPPMIATLAKHYQRDAVRVSTQSTGKQHADIAYQAVKVAQQDAENAIINILRFHDAENAIVFANTRAMVARLTARFSNRGFAVVSLSGELSQNERTHALQAMRDGRARVCVATDVAARGIDLPNLDLVVHAELPTNVEGLLHRSGRTGRAGRKGISALVVPPKMVKRAERLLKWAKISAEWITAPSAEDILARDEERLLADPVWSEEIAAEDAEFAARLAAAHAPERIAAAYLRLYRERHSAPEELSPPDAKPPAKERKPFGPSRWIALSVGREQRAEPRWLLPLLCRAGGLDKSAIGAIRVVKDESYVELSEPAVAGFFAEIGEAGQLEDGIRARLLEGVPDYSARPQPSAPRPPKPERKAEPRPERAERPERTADEAPRPPKPKASRPALLPETEGRETAEPEVKAKPVWKKVPKGEGKPFKKGKPGEKPSGKFGKPAGKFGKPGEKPKGKFGKPGEKPKGKFSKPGKFAGKPGGPGKGKPAGPRRPGGEPPRRKD
ncbi:ATP-dependent RNA helicase, DEAD/DEAH box family protein [Oceanicola granulosus HTCC2516]|uniref:ATP-dependent RNA helicase, DEAD/DEAH box family protein n=1 Tax=Oceanicola granulosus (strain ATCC BAA-861 / DSM 15982 / KCTC 12143 / HTCC2516) TaxID=314256 RepID=Q2CCU3_OCEGH|nr:DEAD/DEAH box helicase [Oceanicola granulosus]EAR50530.1 ATP-dependent RNA helicase, DEAD/DEAH box family protein [Oceanicola granulosus HTCC2516]